MTRIGPAIAFAGGAALRRVEAGSIRLRVLGREVGGGTRRRVYGGLVTGAGCILAAMRPRPRAARARFLASSLVGRVIAIYPVARLLERWRAARAPKPAGPAADGLPLPPARLRVLVDGHGDPEVFVRRSEIAEEQIRDTVAKADVKLEELGAVLDFGCGCGRTARRWVALRGPALHGCDYNPKHVKWCRDNLPFMEFRTNSLEPPSPYPEDSFDLVYALSVVPHMTEELAHRWMAEFARILQPGGLLMLTVHGDAERHMITGSRTGARYDSGEAVTLGNDRSIGTNTCAAFHPPAYVTGRLLTGFELVAFVPGGTDPRSVQDVHLARLPAS
jgi:SAM-dependent methyltransferase